MVWSKWKGAFVVMLAGAALVLRGAHARHLGQLGIGRFNGLAKSFRHIQTGVFSEVNVVNDEVPPGGRTLDGASHHS